MSTTIERPLVDPVVTVWLNRIRQEYRELPGLNLTQAQMQRLCGLQPDACVALIDSLVAARILRRSPTGELVAREY
jgi:hypothetical protein